MYQAEKSVVLLIILIKIWSNFILRKHGSHGSDNIEDLFYDRLGGTPV